MTTLYEIVEKKWRPRRDLNPDQLNELIDNSINRSS